MSCDTSLKSGAKRPKSKVTLWLTAFNRLLPHWCSHLLSICKNLVSTRPGVRSSPTYSMSSAPGHSQMCLQERFTPSLLLHTVCLACHAKKKNPTQNPKKDSCFGCSSPFFLPFSSYTVFLSFPISVAQFALSYNVLYLLPMLLLQDLLFLWIYTRSGSKGLLLQGRIHCFAHWVSSAQQEDGKIPKELQGSAVRKQTNPYCDSRAREILENKYQSLLKHVSPFRWCRPSPPSAPSLLMLNKGVWGPKCSC